MGLDREKEGAQVKPKPYKRKKDGRSAVEVRVNGKVKTIYGKTRKEVAEKMLDAQVAKREGRLVVGRKPTVQEYLNGWLEAVRPSIKPKTHEGYSLHVRRVVPLVGAIRVDKLTPGHIEQMEAELQKTLAAQTVLHVHRCLHRAFGRAVRHGDMPCNPIDLVDAPRPERKEMQTYSVEEVQAVFDATEGDRLHALWVLLSLLGLRLGEALGLKWDDIDWQRRTITNRRALQRQAGGKGLVFVEPKSKSSQRTVEVGETTLRALEAHQSRQAFEKSIQSRWAEHNLVFPSEVGTPLEVGRVHKHWTRATEKAGVRRIRPHDLRHTAASLALASDVHPRVVQELLGHSNISLTLGTYSHVTPTMHREAVETVEKLFRRL